MTKEDSTNNSSSPNISSELISLLGEDLAKKVSTIICQDLTKEPAPPKATSLCLELLVFQIDQSVLKKLVKCTFKQLNPLNILEKIFEFLAKEEQEQKSSSQGSIDKFALLAIILERIAQLKSSLKDQHNLAEKLVKEVLIQSPHIPSPKLKDLSYLSQYILIQEFRETLINQYDNFALKLCNKVTCVYSDLEFLAEQIKLITINFPAAEKGIIEIANAAGNIAEAFFSEQDDFNDIYQAVDEVSKLIQDLAKFYQEKLEQLDKLLALSYTGCPVPIKARETLPSIPKAPPPPPIFPVVGLNGTFTTPIGAP